MQVHIGKPLLNINTLAKNEMSGSQVAAMVSEDGKKGIGKLDKLFTNSFHCHLRVIIVLSFAISFSFTFFPTNGGTNNLKKIKIHIPKVVIKAHHECVILEDSAFTSRTNKLLF